MDLLMQTADLFLHLDRHLLELAGEYGPWIYALLFLIVFLETGVVVTPFLPGDSLLFAAGALAGAGVLEIEWIVVPLTVAAILGDSLNYAIGRHVGPKVFTTGSRFFKQEYLLRTQRFYERHGGKTIVLARFIPIVRTFAPFVAGIGRMSYPLFWAYNAAGGLLWVFAFGFLGFFFGTNTLVKENFSLVLIGIIVISVMPAVVEIMRSRRRPAGSA